MIFETHTPAAPYDQLIESIFHFKGFQPDHSIERVVPTGHVFLLFELDGYTRHTYDSTTLAPNAEFHKAWVSGLHSNHLSISAHDDSEMFVVQFKPGGAFAFLHQPMDKLADRVVSGKEFADKELFSTREKLLSAATSKEKFDVADRWLMDNYDASCLPPKPLLDVVETLDAQPTCKLNDLIQTFDGSQKHLIAQFKKYIGVTPKQYQRIVRFNGIFMEMQGDQFLSWSDIAYRCGYSDQSHFIREFKRFSGFVPEAFLKEEFDEETPNFFPLDRNEAE
ncbi:MAG: helix-turn-helix domain-containing protein [Gammaproteobacteria bacterium]